MHAERTEHVRVLSCFFPRVDDDEAGHGEIAYTVRDHTKVVLESGRCKRAIHNGQS